LNDTSDLVRELQSRNIKTVALQFPEGLKRKAAKLASSLKEAGFSVIISGDPCYGACDLALDALTSADILVHVGHAPVDVRDNVIFLPHAIDIDPGVVEQAIPFLKGPVTGLVTTVQHAGRIPDMQAVLERKGFRVSVAEGSSRTPLRGQVLGCSFAAARNTGAGEILVVATGLFHAIGVAIATRARVVALDPVTGISQEVSGDTLLKRRFAAIERAGGVTDFGIIVSTKSGQQRMDLARRLVSLRPRSVIIPMREVSPDELLNLGFGAYVNTACPRLAYDDQVRFPVPVLSPQEFEILCGVRTWDDYAIDEIV
jgi:2-(3-amino-3-carboxypropyl)histidine synthase